MRKIYGLAEGLLASQEGLKTDSCLLGDPYSEVYNEVELGGADICLLRTLRYWTSLFVLCEELA